MGTVVPLSGQAPQKVDGGHAGTGALGGRDEIVTRRCRPGECSLEMVNELFPRHRRPRRGRVGDSLGDTNRFFLLGLGGIGGSVRTADA